MRKMVIISSCTIVAIAALIQSGVVDALAVFLLSGSLPGTPIALSPTMMMLILIAAAWLTLARLTTLGTLNVLTVRRFIKRHAIKKARMPKRRYSRI